MKIRMLLSLALMAVSITHAEAQTIKNVYFKFDCGSGLNCPFDFWPNTLDAEKVNNSLFLVREEHVNGRGQVNYAIDVLFQGQPNEDYSGPGRRIQAFLGFMKKYDALRIGGLPLSFQFAEDAKSSSCGGHNGLGGCIDPSYGISTDDAQVFIADSSRTRFMPLSQLSQYLVNNEADFAATILAVSILRDRDSKRTSIKEAIASENNTCSGVFVWPSDRKASCAKIENLNQQLSEFKDVGTVDEETKKIQSSLFDDLIARVNSQR